MLVPDIAWRLHRTIGGAVPETQISHASPGSSIRFVIPDMAYTPKLNTRNRIPGTKRTVIADDRGNATRAVLRVVPDQAPTLELVVQYAGSVPDIALITWLRPGVPSFLVPPYTHVSTQSAVVVDTGTCKVLDQDLETALEVRESSLDQCSNICVGALVTDREVLSGHGMQAVADAMSVPDIA
eukprot:205402-Rhodomonas_salina.3